MPDHGACPNYENADWPDGSLCIYCNHGKACHERDKTRPTFNTPTGVGFRDRKLAEMHEGVDVG